MLHILTGDGKGKTSAAVGMAVRMSGYGKKVLFAQFLKGSDSGEIVILKQLPNVQVLRLSGDYGFLPNMTDAEISAVRAEHNEILRTAAQGGYDLIVLDEVIPAMNYGLLDHELLNPILSADCELVLTGRDPQAFLLEKADYVSEIKKIKHPYDKGVPARKGVEF